MKRIYEPQDVEELPESPGVEPHIEIAYGIRMHFHTDGVSFGLISPANERFAAMLTFEQVRELMIKRVKNLPRNYHCRCNPVVAKGGVNEAAKATTAEQNNGE